MSCDAHSPAARTADTTMTTDQSIQEDTTSTTPSTPDQTRLETLIVGGSLAGLTTALALATRGRTSTVLERTRGRTQRGVAILASSASLRQALSGSALRIVEQGLGYGSTHQGTYPQSWWDLYTALRSAADAEPLIAIVENVQIVDVDQNEAEAWAVAADGRVWRAEALLGADGYRSTVRRRVDAAHPAADYAGYVVWLGQSPLPAQYVDRVGGPDFVMHGDDLLGTYPLIDAQQRLRSFGWGWFDSGHNALFRRIGAITGTGVEHTPRPADIPGGVYESMAREAEQWDEPWRSGIIEAFRTRQVIATPITEYLPQRVANERIAVLGDAAHAQTPMTGAGFEEAVADAAALAESFAGDVSATEALQGYELVRLTDMRRRVAGGQAFSRSFAGA